jgi:hypothetical protein
MSAFRVNDANGEAVDMHILDKEAAEFWGKELKEKEYANPSPIFVNTQNLEGKELMMAELDHQFYRTASNWFDTIGYQIANPRVKVNYGKDPHWDNVRNDLWITQMSGYYDIEDTDELCKKTIASKRYLQPYLNLIKHWEDKGYVPITWK